MKSNFYLRVITDTLNLGIIPIDNIFTFPGGEVNIRLPDRILKLYLKEITVIANIRDSDGVMALHLIEEALTSHNFIKLDKLDLELLYLPYARQDRAMQKGEANSLKKFIEIINNMKFDNITLLDVHNEELTLPFLKIPYKHINIEELYKKAKLQYSISDKLVISPDKGTGIKFENKDIPVSVQLSKYRDVKTGSLFIDKIEATTKITHIEGKELLIVDDICDGGATFINVAIFLEKYKPKSISLLVSHGIFSKGTEELFKYIDVVYTTNSFYKGSNKKIKIIII